MKIQNFGHVLTRLFGAACAICAALAAQNTFPSLTPYFAAAAGVAGVLAVPTVVKS